MSSTAEKIVSGLGGRDNISDLEPCITRLRVEVEDQEKVDEDALRAAGAFGAAGLPVKAPQWPVDDYLRYMSIDKKADRGTPVFVVLDGLGKAATTRADEALVREVIATHLG